MVKALLLEDLYLRCGGQQIFSEVNMEAARGEIVAVCGTSGSCRDAFVKLLTRTFDVSYTLTGRLLVDGAEIERLPEEEMRFARMMNIAVLPNVEEAASLHMSVQKYITLPFRESVKKTTHEMITDTKRIMQLLGVKDPERILHKRMSALHVKDLRAVLYATALSTDPAVAIAFADAPDMSPHEADELYTLLIKVCKIKNIALLLLTSDIHFARRFGEQVFIAKHDRIFPLEGAAHPYTHFLEAAAEMRAISFPARGENALLTAVNAVPARGMQSMDFTLHSGEILAFSCKNGIPVFSGKRNPVSGTILTAGTPIKKHKDFSKGVMPIFADMPFPPAFTADEVVCAFAVRPSKRLGTAQIYTAIGLSSDYGKTPVPPNSIYETLRLGLACAAAAEAKIILLSDIDLLPAAADRYEIFTLLSAVCAHTGAGALVFSDRTDVLHALGTRFYKEETTAEVAEAPATTDSTATAEETSTMATV